MLLHLFGNRKLLTISRSFSSKDSTFVRGRAVYNKQVSEVRKRWQEEFKIRRDHELQEKKAERERIVLEKAIRLRQFRSESLLRQANTKRAQELAQQLVQEKLAKSIVKNEHKLELEQQRLKMMIQDFQDESKTWLNESNIETRITAKLFTKQATTGLVTKQSEHWRWHLITMDPKRIMNPAFMRQYAGDSLEDRMEVRGGVRSAQRIFAQDFLDPMIGTGEERAKYRELVDKFTSTFQQQNAQPEVEDYFDYLVAKRADEININRRTYAGREEDLDLEEEEEADEEGTNKGDGAAVAGKGGVGSKTVGKNVKKPIKKVVLKKPMGKK